MSAGLTKNQEQILALKSVAINGYDKVVSQFLELEKGYMAFLGDDVIRSLRKREKSYIPTQIIRAKVRKIERDIMKTYFSTDELGTVEIDGDEKLSVVMQKKLGEYASAKSSLYTIMRPLIRDALVYGTTVLKVYWSEARNKVVIQPRSLSEICIDPYARNHFDAKFMVDRFYMTVADIKASFKKAKKMDFSNVSSTSSNNIVKNQEQTLNDYKRVEVAEVYRIVDGKWFVSTIVNNEFLRTDDELNDGNPILFGVIFPQFVGLKEYQAIRSYGDSYIAPMIPVQTQYIVSRNQQFDAIDLQLNPRFLATRNSGLRDDDLGSNKKKIQVNSIDSIKELPAPNINQSIFDTNKLDEELQEVGGLPKFAQGIATSSTPNSATGTTLLSENGNTTVDDIITSLNENLIQAFLTRILKLTYKHEVSTDFAGYDRTKDIVKNVTINAGVGAMTRSERLNNLDNAILSLSNTVKLFLDGGMQQKATEYIVVLDELTKEKAKLLGVKNIEEKMKNAINVFGGTPTPLGASSGVA